MPKRSKTRQVGTLGNPNKTRRLTKTLETYKVVGIHDQEGLIEYGKFGDFGEAKTTADTHATDDQICVVYGLDSRVVFSTER